MAAAAAAAAGRGASARVGGRPPLPPPPPPPLPPNPRGSNRGGGGGGGAFLAKEEEYRRLNAELEAKTAELVRQAEQVMRDQQEALSRPFSAQLPWSDEEAKSQRGSPSSDQPPLPLGLHKQQPPKKKATSSVPTTARSGAQPGKARRGMLPSVKVRPRNTPSSADVALPDFSLAKTIGRIEGELEEGKAPDLDDDLLPSAASELGAEAQIRFLKAKLRVMQEELDALAQECGKKDDENRSVSGRLKEAEEECGRLQRAASLQQAQLEKYKALSEEAKRRSEGLQQKLSGLDKELENLKRVQKQASASQSTMEVRLNRALEESEKYKMELNRVKQSNKAGWLQPRRQPLGDAVNQEHKRLEELKMENKRLEKQKEELMAGFKKQLKLIDILKRQKARGPGWLVFLLLLLLLNYLEGPSRPLTLDTPSFLLERGLGDADVSV
ncbi:hypothetical protein JRQ81_006941 [Phrynocephalus forsythii]|uniref:Testis-expressed sequence 9 protein n=1 Tax=Phrynocephalus forsythii TaxID=171643 RepID=A0A9Q0XEE8_9SAUR|nr:hypothetical protein JRQ81_006941 [Phrynocephalus forsythii]